MLDTAGSFSQTETEVHKLRDRWSAREQKQGTRSASDTRPNRGVVPMEIEAAMTRALMSSDGLPDIREASSGSESDSPEPVDGPMNAPAETSAYPYKPGYALRMYREAEAYQRSNGGSLGDAADAVIAERQLRDRPFPAKRAADWSEVGGCQ